MKTGTEINGVTFYRVNNDVNGNPRYVVHFYDLLSESDEKEISELPEYYNKINAKFNRALDNSRKLGGKKYRGNDFGGGIVFQSYNINTLANEINSLRK